MDYSLMFILVRLKNSLPFLLLQHHWLTCMSMWKHTGVCVHTHAHTHAHTCASVSPTDEKEESILGSIPLLSFRVAAVQPSDNISRKHTFKVSWTSPSGQGKEGVCSSRTRGLCRLKSMSLRSPCMVAEKGAGSDP